MLSLLVEKKRYCGSSKLQVIPFFLIGEVAVLLLSPALARLWQGVGAHCEMVAS